MSRDRGENHLCPYLGMMEDAHTSLNFPSNWNLCNHCEPAATPKFKHQEEFCLGGKFEDCPLFSSDGLSEMPRQILIENREVTSSFWRRYRLIAIGVLFALALPVGWKLISERFTADVKSEQTPIAALIVPTSMEIVPPTIDLPFDSTLTPAPVSTPIVASISTSGASGHQLETPIGTDYKFVIHRILEGETIEQFADQFDTSVEAILAVNSATRNPGWSGTLLVIPVGFTDVTALPSFIVYQVQETDRGSSIEAMAQNLRVTPLDLKYYNGWSHPGDRPLVGDYLLVPRARPIE